VAFNAFMPTLSANLHALLTLQLVPGLGPRLTAALLEKFGSAEAVLQAGPEQLREVPRIGDKVALDLHQAMREVDVAAEMEAMERHQVRLLALGTAEYPASLATIFDPPHLLYARGDLQQSDANAVAIVGSRHCTNYGKRQAERLAAGLVQKGFTVISGLARGIDAAAHRGALTAGGRTIAVLAGGLSKIYPPEHAELAQHIQTSGALLSEATMSMEPMGQMFPARNRLISGLSRGVVVVEAAEHSGALITARSAGEQGRTVFAVPGPVDSPTSAGTHALLRQGAILVRGVSDIIEELDGVTAAVNQEQVKTPPGLDETQRKIWDHLSEQTRHIDELVRHVGQPVPQVTSALMTLEMKRVIKRLPGNSYQRC
jgi:DNA processing protein